MLFNSFEFIFLFLPIMLGLFYLTLRFKLSNSTLIILSMGSMIFYGYWSIKYLFLLLISIVINFMLGNVLKKHRSKIALTCGIIFNLGLLGYYKYFNFFLELISPLTVNGIKSEFIILPLAISFYTFQQITYLCDSYKGQIQENKFLEYLFFVIFFPQLIAGPIVQHREIIPQLVWAQKYKVFWENCVVGLTVFSIGLVKKTVIADNIAALSTPVFDGVANGQVATFFEAWIATIAYSLQVYFDFSGYSDMAIGLARMFGILLPQNFNSPFKSRSIMEYWQRWHMTMGRFIHHYIFLPLSLFFMRFSYFKKKNIWVSSFFTSILTFLIVGFWHGAGWTFICFGIIQGIYYFCNFAWQRLFSQKYDHKLKPYIKTILSYVYWAVTYFSLIISFVLFRAKDIACAKSMYAAMLGVNGYLLTERSFSYLNYFFGLGNFAKDILHWRFENSFMLIWLGKLEVGLCVALLFIIFAMPNTQEMISHYQPCLDNKPHLYKKSILTITWQPNIRYAFLVSFALLAAYFFIAKGNSEFLYFAF